MKFYDEQENIVYKTSTEFLQENYLDLSAIRNNDADNVTLRCECKQLNGKIRSYERLIILSDFTHKLNELIEYHTSKFDQYSDDIKYKIEYIADQTKEFKISIETIWDNQDSFSKSMRAYALFLLYEMKIELSQIE